MLIAQHVSCITLETIEVPIANNPEHNRILVACANFRSVHATHTTRRICKAVSNILFLYKRPKLMRELKNGGFGHAIEMTIGHHRAPQSQTEKTML